MHSFIERFQPLLKYLYLAVDIRFQGLCIFGGYFQLLQLLIKPVYFLQRGIHVQGFALRFRLCICTDEQSLSGADNPVFISAQFATGAAGFALIVHQVPAVELRLAVFRGELDMLLATFVLHPQF